MSAAVNTITIKRNNDRNLSLTVKKDGVPQDITDWIVYFSVKKFGHLPDDQAIIYKEVTAHTNPTAGETTISILAADTASDAVDNYSYDILIVDDQGKRQSSQTGTFVLEQEITDGDG